MFHPRQAQMLDVHTRSGQSKDRAVAAKASLDPELFQRIGEKRQTRCGVVAEKGWNLGTGRRYQTEFAIGPVHLRQAQAVGAEVDADGVGGGGEPALYV